MEEFIENVLTFYCYAEVILGILIGLLLAFRTKKADGVTYTNLDRAGKIFNIVLLFVYAVLSPVYLFIGAISYPAYSSGILAVIGIILALIVDSVALCAAVGLGASVALRKKGKSKLSFAVQFAGIAAMGIMLVIFFLCYGNLFATIN